MNRFVRGLLGALLVCSGCARSVGDVDRTQPNKVEKAVFQADPATGAEKLWYYRATVTEVPFSTGFAFVGLQSQMEKVVWDIQEDMLVAYRAYEHVKGSEAWSTRPGTRFRGAPIAAFPITSHFDVVREYNPATGEQTNVIVENTSDRPWHERRYMRVDWGDNRIANVSFAVGDLKTQAMYYVQPTDADAKDRPQVGPGYVDVTAKLFVEPETVEFPGEGAVPMCWLWTGVTRDCYGQAIKVRHSFLQATDDSEEYEPLPYDSKQFAKFGYFSTKRYVYDRERDLLEGGVEQFAERWNLWAKSRVRNADGGFDPIPLERRALRPVVYYVNDQFPRVDAGDDVGLLDQAQHVADAWDAVFRDTVEKVWATGDPAGPNAGKKPARLFFTCRNNPVTDDDTNLDAEPDLSQFDVRDEAGNVVGTSVPFPAEAKPQNRICGPKGLNPQIGDLRYSFQYWVPSPQIASPLGYGPHAADEETGRVIQANAYLYGSQMETYATQVADMVSLMVGDLEEQDLADGTVVRALLEERQGRVPEVFLSVKALRDYARDRGFDARARELVEAAKDGRLAHDYLTANLEALRGSWAASFLITDEVVKGLGDGSDLATVQADPARRARLNPSNWGHPAYFDYYQRRLERLSRADITGADFHDDALWSRALKMAEQYRGLEKRARFKAIRRDLLKELYVASMIHEVGHTVGLRHNFAASADALNYFTGGKPFNPALAATLAPRVDPKLGTQTIDPTDYWSLRPVAQAEGVAAAKLSNPLQPTYLVPFDSYVLKTYPLKELQYTSIMDYSAKPNGDLFGLGKYDFAAIRFAYGRLVDVFDPAAAGHPKHALDKDLAAKLKAGEYHYTFLPYLFAGTRDPKDLQKGIDLMVKGRKTIRWTDLQAARGQGAAPVEVPYLFCSDEYKDGSSVCYAFDEGPDMYEMTQNVQSMYESLYWFNNFKRGRVSFALGGSMGGYANRVMARYFNVLSNQYKHFVNDELIIRSRRNATCLEDFTAEDAPENRVDHYVSPLCGLDQLAAAYSSLNFFGRVLATPDVGRYGLNPATGAFQKDFEGEDFDGNPVRHLDVGLGTGRYAQSGYDRERYGYDFFYKPVLIGSWWDKYLAIQALGNPYTKFIGVDTGSDTLAYLINFNDLFYSEVNNLVGGLAIQDFRAYAPVADDQGKVTFRVPAPLFANQKPNLAGTTPVDPDEQYTTRLLAAFLGISFFSDEKSDTKFINSIKINVAGVGDTPEVPADVRADPEQYVEVSDPNTRKTYWATRYDHYRWNGKRDPDTVPLGFKLLSTVKDRCSDATGNLDGGCLASELHFVEILRGMVHHWEYVRGM